MEILGHAMQTYNRLMHDFFLMVLVCLEIKLFLLSRALYKYGYEIVSVV